MDGAGTAPLFFAWGWDGVAREVDNVALGGKLLIEVFLKCAASLPAKQRGAFFSPLTDVMD
jgi:hypothetical protein